MQRADFVRFTNLFYGNTSHAAQICFWVTSFFIRVSVLKQIHQQRRVTGDDFNWGSLRGNWSGNKDGVKMSEDETPGGSAVTDLKEGGSPGDAPLQAWVGAPTLHLSNPQLSVTYHRGGGEGHVATAGAITGLRGWGEGVRRSRQEGGRWEGRWKGGGWVDLQQMGDEKQHASLWTRIWQTCLRWNVTLPLQASFFKHLHLIFLHDKFFKIEKQILKNCPETEPLYIFSLSITLIFT